MERTPGKRVIPFLPLALDVVTMASSNRTASVYWQTSVSRVNAIRNCPHASSSASLVSPQYFLKLSTLLTPCEPVGRSQSHPISDDLAHESLTTQDPFNIQARIRLSKQLPGSDHTCGRIYQGTVHIKQAADHDTVQVSLLEKLVVHLHCIHMKLDGAHLV